MMLSNSLVLAVFLSSKLYFLKGTAASYLGVGHLPSCAYSCLNAIMWGQYSCHDLKCFCQNSTLTASMETCFHKECDLNSLPKACKLLATCQESYGSAPPPSSSSSALPPTPVGIYPGNAYSSAAPTTPIGYSYNGPGWQINAASQVLPSQPQVLWVGSPQSSAAQPQGPAAQPQGTSAQPQALPGQPQAPAAGSLSISQAQAPAGGQSSGAQLHGPANSTESGSQHQFESSKGGMDNSATPAPETKTTTPLFSSVSNSSSKPFPGPAFSSAQGTFENRLKSPILCLVIGLLILTI